MDVLVAKLMGWVEEEESKVIGEPFIIYYSSRHEVGNREGGTDVGIVLDDEEDPVNRFNKNSRII